MNNNHKYSSSDNRELVDVFEVPVKNLTCYGTRLWASKKALKVMTKYKEKKDNPKGALMRKLSKYCQKGFEHYEGPKGMPLKSEWGGIWRLRHDKLRIIGFYEDNSKTNFIAVDGFEKQSQKLTTTQRKRIDNAAKIKQEKTWTKKVNYERS